MFASVLGISWATPFFLISIYGIARYFAKNGKVDQSQINWRPFESVAITLLIYFVSQIVAGLIVYVVPLLSGWSLPKTSDWLDNNSYGQFVLVLTIEAIAVAMLYYFIKRRGASLRAIGLKKPRWLDLAYVFIGYLAYFVIFIVALGLIKHFVSIDTNQQQQIGFENASGLQLPFVFAALVLMPPIVEELLFRGFLYSGLRKGLPFIGAVLITSGLFASAHLQAGSGQPLLWSAAIDTFILSLVLIYIKEKTGSLAACIGLHMLKNCIAFLGLFVFHLI